jgi:hypothetical protein
MGVLLPIAILVAAYVATAVVIIEAITALTAIAIIAAVIAAASTAAATYFYIQGDIQNSMLFAGIAITAGIGGVYVSYISEVANVNALLAEGTAQAVAAAQAAQTSFAFTVVSYVDAAYSSWQTIADMLHLKLAAQINQIAYLVSEDYRNAFDNVFKQISQVSSAMGWGALTLNLLLENSRTLVLDVSSSLGEGYDIGQIKWLNTLNGFLTEFNKNSNYYRDNPARFIDFIADGTYRPALDAKAGTVRSIFQGIETALGLIKVTAEDLTKLKNDTLKLVGDLPQVIRDQIMPGLTKITNEFDNFIKLTYDPALKKIDAAMAIFGVDLEAEKVKAQALVQRLLRPGKYLSEIKDLDAVTRQEDEDMVADIATAPLKRQAAALLDTWKNPLLDGIKEIDLLENKPLPAPPDFLKLERVRAAKEEEIEKRESPFVGDY